MPLNEPPTLCPICDAAKKPKFLRDYSPAPGFSLYQCADCYVQYWSPLTNPQSDWYHNNYSLAYDLREIFSSNLERPMHRKFVAWMAMRSHSRTLDFGCGTGEVVGALRKQGHESYGVDFGERAIVTAKRNFGESYFFCQSVEEFFKNPPVFELDVISFFEVIEHLEKPQILVVNAKSILRDHGRIVLSTPSRDRWGTNLNDWDFPPHHLTRWNLDALDNLFVKNGFVRESVSFFDSFNFILSGILGEFRRRFGVQQVTAAAVAIAVSSSNAKGKGLAKTIWWATKVIKYVFFGLPALLVWLATRTIHRGGMIVVTYRLELDSPETHAF
jgi:SAM-dependent methyltransferase